MIRMTSRSPEYGFEVTGNPDATWQVKGGQKYLQQEGHDPIINQAGNLPLSGIYRIESEVYEDAFSLWFWATRRAQWTRWEETKDHPDGFYAWVAELPPGLSVDDWMLIFQLHAKQGLFAAFHVRRDGCFLFKTKMPQGPDGGETLWDVDYPAITGKPFAVIMELKAHSLIDGGMLRLWLNPDFKADPDGFIKVGEWSRDLFDPVRPGPAFMADVYQAPDSGQNRMVLYRMASASTYDSLVEHLKEGLKMDGGEKMGSIKNSKTEPITVSFPKEYVIKPGETVPVPEISLDLEIT